MYQRGKISPTGLMYLLFISRIAVSLTNVQSITMGKISSDILISLVLSLAITLFLSLPAIFCITKGKSPFDVRWLGYLYFLYFVFISAVNISRFSYFASTTLNPDSQSWIIIFIICVCICYCVNLGIEAISRFAGFGFIVMLLGALAVILSNIEEYNEINLYPIVTDSRVDILKNAFILSSNTTEIIVLLCLKNRVNGVPVKAYVNAILLYFVTIFLLILFMLAVMGESTQFKSFPFYTFFQISKIGTYERLDVIHISFWIMGIFIKSVLTVYCASISVKSMKSTTKSIIASVITFVLALVFAQTGMSGNMKPLMIALPFAVFCVIIPLLTLIFKKRSTADALIERF